LACERGCHEILQIFFDGGADPNFCDGLDKLICIHWPLQFKWPLPILTFLFSLSNQNSPLFLAAQAGQLLAVNALVAAKADVEKRNV
jgi:ankyrin repeat protein